MSITSEELNYLIWRYLQETGNELSALALQEETRVKEFDKLYKQHIPLGTLVNLVQKGILFSESELFVEQLDRAELIDLFKSSNSHTHNKLEEYINNRNNKENSNGSGNSSGDVSGRGSIFNLANALRVDTKSIPEFEATGRFALVNDDIERDLKEEGGNKLKLGSKNDTVDSSYNRDNEQDTTARTVTSMTSDTTDSSMSSSHSVVKELKLFVPNWRQSYLMKEKINYLKWNPQRRNIIAFGIRNEAIAKIIQFKGGSNESNDEIRELRHPFALSYTMGNTTNEITCLEWSNDGNHILTAVENGEIRLWSYDGVLKNVFNFHRVPIISIKWNYNSTLFLSMDIENVIILWNALNGTVVQHFELMKSNSGNIETSYNSSHATINNNSNSNSIHNTNDNSMKNRASNNNDIDMKDINSNAMTSSGSSNNVSVTRDNKIMNINVNGTEVAWVDKDRFVLPGNNGKLNVYSIQSKQPIGRLIGHEQTISGIEFNGSNKLLATSSDDLTIRVWHGSSSNPNYIFYGHSQNIISIEWINDDLIVSCSLDGTIRIWSIQGQGMVAMNLCDGVPIICGRLSNDKEKYAIGLLDGQIKLYDVSYVLKEYETSSKKKKEKNDILQQPLSIPLCGEYSSNKSMKSNNSSSNTISEDSMVFDLSWNKDDSKIAISYSNKPGIILTI